MFLNEKQSKTHGFNDFRPKSHSRLGETHIYDQTANQAPSKFSLSSEENPQARETPETVTKPGAAKTRPRLEENPHRRQRAPTRTTSIQTRPFRTPSVVRIRSTFTTKRCERTTFARPSLHQGPTNQPTTPQGSRRTVHRRGGR